MQAYITSSQEMGEGLSQSICHTHAVWLDVSHASERAYCLMYKGRKVWVPKSLCKLESFYHLDKNDYDGLCRFVRMALCRGISPQEVVFGDVPWFCFSGEMLDIEKKQAKESDVPGIVPYFDDVDAEIDRLFPGVWSKSEKKKS